MILVTPKAILRMFTLTTSMSLTVEASPQVTPTPSVEPTANTTGGTPWAMWVRFYDDEDCKTNPGVWVDTSNPGCLANQGSRKSFDMKQKESSPGGMTTVVYSPGSSCDCQNYCRNEWLVDFIGKTHCYKLRDEDTVPKAGSYRFLGTFANHAYNGCDPNNC